MIIYGSYLSKKEDIPRAAMQTALLDTCAALLAGFAILPAVFAFGMDPASGPPLIFITLPKVFAQMPGGRFIAVLFFLSVIFAGITSLINMFEVCAEAVTTHLKLPLYWWARWPLRRARLLNLSRTWANGWTPSPFMSCPSERCCARSSSTGCWAANASEKSL